MRIDVKAGSKYRWNSRTVEIDGILNRALASARDCATGEELRIPVSELRVLNTVQETRRPGVIPQADWDQSKLVRSVLEPYIESGRIPKKALKRAARLCDRSVR